MSNEIPETFQPLSLSYSAQIRSTGSTPHTFYNAFPELNGKAADGSLTAFPNRAKYSLVLDSFFLPSGVWVTNSEQGRQHVASLSPAFRKALFEELNNIKSDTHAIIVPRNQASEGMFQLETWFELTHQRLTTARYKWKIRQALIAPFLTTLEQSIVSGQKIPVPLIPDNSLRASELQRQWANISYAFKNTLIPDEVTSLLATLLLAAAQGRDDILRQAGDLIRQQENEIKGFTDVYKVYNAIFGVHRRINKISQVHELLPEFMREHTREEVDSLFRGYLQTAIDVADVIVGATQLILFYENLQDAFNNEIAQYLAGLEPVQRLIEANANLRFLGDSRNAPHSISMAEATLRLLSGVTYGQPEQDKSFGQVEYFDFPQLVMFDAPNKSNSYFLIAQPTELIAKVPFMVRRPSYFAACRPNPFVPFYEYGPDGFDVAMAYYFLFIEAIRQQICTGVGLHCPFWNEEGCCESFRAFLHRTYEITTPATRRWEKYWEKPPCLL